jgi:hypothetical protein
VGRHEPQSALRPPSERFRGLTVETVELSLLLGGDLRRDRFEPRRPLRGGTVQRLVTLVREQLVEGGREIEVGMLGEVAQRLLDASRGLPVSPGAEGGHTEVHHQAGGHDHPGDPRGSPDLALVEGDGEDDHSWATVFALTDGFKPRRMR